MERIELLKQNLAIEPDLQSFTGFVLESVNRLGGSGFAAAIALLRLIERLRDEGVAAGHLMSVSLMLEGQDIFVRWGAQEQVKIATLRGMPNHIDVYQLRVHLLNSTASADPDILLQRNAEMMRYFDETRARAEKELDELQRTLLARQQELVEFSHQVETDALTGILNRRAFDEKVRQAFLHTMRQKNSPLSLMFFDLDHFKQINDEFGHQFGDAYLNKMASTLREIIREDVDFAFRFGGDEFAVVLFADYRLACEKARQVLGLMENKVSIGITAINKETPDDLTLEEFIRRADKALYEAKHLGRGQAVIDLCASQAKGKCQSPCPEMTIHTCPVTIQTCP